MNWTFHSDRAIYLQLMEYIERDIISGAMEPGARMPSVRELATMAGISPNTVQRAMYEMERTGLLLSRGTEGKYITDDRDRIARMRQDLARQKITGFVRDMQQLGFDRDEVQRLFLQLDADE